MVESNKVPNRSRSIIISASTATPDYLINRRVQWVQCSPTNTGEVTINGNDSYSPGYNGPGSGVLLAGVSGTVGDKVTLVVEA